MANKTIHHTELLARMNKLMDSGFSEIDLYIIKSHLVVENELVQFIESMTGGTVKGITFNQLLKIVDELYNGFYIPKYARADIMRADLLKFIKLLTELRNQIAHKITFDNKTMQRAIAHINEANDKDKQIKEPEVGMFNNYILLVAIALVEKSGKEIDYSGIVIDTNEKAVRGEDAASKETGGVD